MEDVENENQDLEEQQRIEDFNVNCDEAAKHRHQEVQLGDWKITVWMNKKIKVLQVNGLLNSNWLRF